MSLLAQYKMRKHDIGDNAVFVVDSLFDEQLVRMAHHFLSRLEFTLSDYDTEETKHTRHWKHELYLNNLPTIPVLPALISRIVTVTTEMHNSRKLRLKRIHCNVHLYGDLQYPHTDLKPGVTALYFANPYWEVNWMGETVFYNREGEPLYAVIPKPGRLLVFDGEIAHRGGVPSRECFEPRISLALKFMIDEE